MKLSAYHRSILFAFLAVLVLNTHQLAAAPLRVLFLGDNGPHKPAEKANVLIPVLEHRGINLVYTTNVNDLNEKTLSQYDGLLLYANIDQISEAQAGALLGYVNQGGGFIPLHCASYCFRNNSDVVALMGGQFLRHGGEVFRTKVVAADHPIMRGYRPFESWDETYVHHLHNDTNRTVLEVRETGMQAQGRDAEPWTWVRTHGEGRVFYSAWGHDLRTWREPAFINLVERGIRWACGEDPEQAGAVHNGNREFPVPEMTAIPEDLTPFEYVDVGPKIPNYTSGAQWGTQDKPLNLMQQPLAAEEARKHIVTPKQFEVRLFASDPDIQGKPIAMAWDEDDRLYVCETVDYPNELNVQTMGRDRIRLCEDTDDDGKADRFVTFAEGLTIPAAITIARGGVIVQDGTETVFLQDTDGDDKADVRKVLISGWNMRDTHGGVSNFQYGLDNWIWAMQGYNYSEPVANGRKYQGFRNGFWRFKLDHENPPNVTQIEFIRSTDNNTWGLGISEEGLIFGSTANRNPSEFMPIPNRYYENVRGWAPQRLEGIADTHLFDPITDKVRQVDHHGGYTAGAGHALYTARRYPQEYWNRTAFVCGPTGHLVGTFVLKRDGAGYQSTSPFNLFASDDEWSAPIMAEVGPDGNVWVIDWYNYIVQHNPTPRGFETGKGNAYKSDLRDKVHGRIYRVVVANEPAPRTGDKPLVDLSKQLTSARDPERLQRAFASGAAEGFFQDQPPLPYKLLYKLRSPNMLIREHGQRQLIERGQTDVVPWLLKEIANEQVDEIGLNTSAIHALWTLDGLDTDSGRASAISRAAIKALSHPSAGVRRNAIQVLPKKSQTLSAFLESGVLHDIDLQVRLAAILALSEFPGSDQAAEACVAVATNPVNLNDRWLRDALTSAAASHAVPFLERIVQEDIDPRLTPRIAIVGEHVAREGHLNRIAPLLDRLAKSDPAVSKPIIAAFANAWPKTSTSSADSPITKETMLALFEKLDAEGQSQLFSLATKWNVPGLKEERNRIAKTLLKQLDDDGTSTQKKVAAAEQAVALLPDDKAVVRQLLSLISPRIEPDLARGLMRAVSRSRTDDWATRLVEQFPELSTSLKNEATRILLASTPGTNALLGGMQSGDVSVSLMGLDQRQALLSHPNESIQEQARKVLSQGGMVPNADRQKVLEALLSVTEKSGDVEAGREIFKKNCANCHQYRDIGEKVGPNLTGMAVHPKEELLVHILDPSRSVEENYRSYLVVTLDGLVINGMVAAESKNTLELIDTQGKSHVVLREDIDQFTSSGKSIMPEGFEKTISEDQFVDLLEYLTQKGKYVPLNLEKVATAISTKGMFHDGDNGPDRLILDAWEPRTVNEVPFQLVDPQGKRNANVILLNGPLGTLPPRMPKSVSLPCNTPAKAIHLLSGVGGWSFPAIREDSTSMIVRLHYANAETEDHELKNGIHFADYIRRVDVEKSQFAFMMGGQQMRYLSIEPAKRDVIERIEFVKGSDRTAPIVLAVTVETK